jgi:hypothetical protein
MKKKVDEKERRSVIFLPFDVVDLFDERSRRNFDFSFRSFDDSSLTLRELFFNIITIIITYDTVITITGTI